LVRVIAEWVGSWVWARAGVRALTACYNGGAMAPGGPTAVEYPSDLKYTKEHEWLRVTGNRGRVGITAHAQDQLGDVVYVNLPTVGTEVKQFEMFGDIDSVKTNSALYSPVSGTIAAINEQVNDQPELVNQDPYGAGWMIEIDLANPGEVEALLTAEQYQETLGDH
jgi:glycine cleavage system H protein